MGARSGATGLQLAHHVVVDEILHIPERGAQRIPPGHPLELALDLFPVLAEQRLAEGALPFVAPFDGPDDLVGGLVDPLQLVRGPGTDLPVVVQDVVVLESVHQAIPSSAALR